MKQKRLLGYYAAKIQHYQILRELTAEEIEQNTRFIPIYREAFNRLKLFRMLGLNYEAWDKFTRSLLTIENSANDDMLVADQLLFNFLATAYGITEHFKVSFQKRFKKQPVKIQEYKDFLDRLCTGCWAVAFFFDFRNYVQHIALPVGNFHKKASRNKVEIKIEQDAAKLVQDYSHWERSKLDASRGKLDLIDISSDYFLYLKRDYAKYVAKTFYPELIELQEFYSKLTREAAQGDRDKRMVFFERVRHKGLQGKVTLVFPPNDPMTEMGILVEQSPPQSA